jgi:hypothetical protein
MSDHDPLCYQSPGRAHFHKGEPCVCELIDEVRADEQQKNTPLDVAAFRAAVVEQIAQAIEAEALGPWGNLIEVEQAAAIARRFKDDSGD